MQKLVQEISQNHFSRPFKHQATFNPRLRTTGGRYSLATHHLDFNPKVLETFGMEEFIGVVKHELCHYHLHLAGKGFQHKDPEFKQLLKQVGGTRFVRSLRKPETEKAFWVYRCKNCGQSLYRQRRFDTRKYVCGSCRGKLVLQQSKTLLADSSGR